MADLFDLRTPWCMYVVATLRIAQRIEGGTCTLDALAAEAECDAVALGNVMGHLVGAGVFAEPSRDTYALTGESRVLFDPFLDLHGIGGRMAHAWSTLETYVRTGRPGYAERFGVGWWEDLAAHPELGTEFDELMGVAGHGTPDPWFSLVDGWDDVRWVVDVGGGTGAMLASLLDARPGLRGTLVDLPGTVARAAGDFETVGQSFFDPLPAGADLYLLRSVLNDWPDAETDAILARVAAACGDAGRVVVMGGVAPDDAPRRLDIEMVLLGGRTDTLSEFRDRSARVGLAVVAASRQDSGRYVVELRHGV